MKLKFELRGVVFLDVNTCINIRNITGESQGTTMFLWYRENKKIRHDVPNEWVILKRNKYDLSRTGDVDGLSRWVAALTYSSGFKKEREYKKI